MRKFYLIIILLYLSNFSFGQELTSGMGFYQLEHGECVPTTERARINNLLENNYRSLETQGKLPAARNEAAEYVWPVRQRPGFNYNSVYGISNYVDHNEGFSGNNNNNVIDYNCGDRSYDTGSGYNHTGTDIFTWPFSWQMMQDEQVEIVAITDGVILGKDDFNPDQNCSFDAGTGWNAVYVLHNDGGRSWYGHMKSGSLTDKVVGDPVEAGEFLGLIGSSGISTGPHLHLEIYDADGDLIDPYDGTCNPTVTETWWAEQKPYREPTINTIMTHFGAPDFLGCPNPTQQVEFHRQSNCFERNDFVFFAAYFHDQLAGDPFTNTIYYPDGSVYETWERTAFTTYNASYWYRSFYIENDDPTGIWTYEVSYNEQTVTHQFTVGDLTLAPIEGALVSGIGELETYSITPQDGFTYSWEVSGGTIVDENAEQGTIQVQWENEMEGELCVTGENALACQTDTQCLTVDLSPVNISDIKGLDQLQVLPNPARERFRIQLTNTTKIEQLQIDLLDITGKVVQPILSSALPSGSTTLDVAVPHLAAGIYLLRVSDGAALGVTRLIVQ